MGIQYAMPYSQKYTLLHCFFAILLAGYTDRVHYNRDRKRNFLGQPAKLQKKTL